MSTPYPFGVLKQGEKLNFSLVSPHAKKVTLCFFDPQNKKCVAEYPLCPQKNRTGQVWHIAISDLDEKLLYAYKIDPPLNKNQHFVLDPYAKDVDAGIIWGKNKNYHPLGRISLPTDFDWTGESRPSIPINDLIIYEMHVRGFTQSPSSQVNKPGSFLGVIEKIPHLLDLGINAIELLPIQEFNEMEYLQAHPNLASDSPLYNFWGYSTVNFFSPMQRYATSMKPGAAIDEFKTMVKALHQHGIEVLLDVVFNHTAEGNNQGPILSFKGIDNALYYLLDEHERYFNFSGCGNSFNANHPVVQEFIIDCLRYWVTEMHVDGFRFDLASALTRGTNGNPLQNAPLIEAITRDPILASTKLIAEPWDADGLYQVGHFAPQTVRWCEWNGKYRDSVRSFIKGTPHSQSTFSMRICGSQDLYSNRKPYSSINFITSHDGFTLADLVSYNTKHNLSNGEDNRDGTNDNESWNCGVEGETTDEEMILLRERQMRNFHLALIVSQGIPMLQMGDEYGHSKGGNNNTWCHDAPINWFLWDKLKENASFYRFYRGLIDFRKKHPTLKHTSFLSPTDIDWHGTTPFHPNWNNPIPFIAFTLKDNIHAKDLYIAFNAHSQPITVTLPSETTQSMHWRWVVNTANASPNDFFLENDRMPLETASYTLEPFSAILLEKSAHRIHP